MGEPADLLRLPFTPDLNRWGISYALRALPYGEPGVERLQQCAAEGMVGLALRRYLAQEGIPFEVTQPRRFTNPVQHDVVLGGRRCELICQVVTQSREIEEVTRQPERLGAYRIEAPQAVNESDHDLLLYCFFLGRASQTEMPNAHIHLTPAAWSSPKRWRALGKLSLTCMTNGNLALEVIGQTQKREHLRCAIDLQPGKAVALEAPFYAVSAIQAASKPDGLVELFNRMAGRHVILPQAWKNLWWERVEILMAGYMTQGEVRMRNLANGNESLRVADLRPMDGLLEQVRKWAGV